MHLGYRGNVAFIVRIQERPVVSAYHSNEVNEVGDGDERDPGM